MTNEQKEKINELRKLGIGYRSIATAMGFSRDSVRNFFKSSGWMALGRIIASPSLKRQSENIAKTVGSGLIRRN